jgi:hypothetical protein
LTVTLHRPYRDCIDSLVRWLWNSWWDKNWQGKQKQCDQTCPISTLSTTHPTWPGPEPRPPRWEFHPEDGGITFLWNFSELLPDSTVSHTKMAAVLKKEIFECRHNFVVQKSATR